MPCLEWSAKEVEWEQRSSPRGPMSCKTQGWISIHPEKAYLKPLGPLGPLGQFSMIFDKKFCFFFFNFLSIFLFYSMRMSHFFLFFHQFFMKSIWNYAFFSFFSQFFMLLNEKFAFFYFFCKFSILFNSMGGLHFVNFPYFSIGIWNENLQEGRHRVSETYG